MNDESHKDHLIETLRALLGPDAVIDDAEERRFYSADAYAEGAQIAAAIRPKDKDSLCKAIAAATAAGYAVIGRGGGMSYTKGYVPRRATTVTVDVSALNRIIEINERDMYITVEAGVTWKQIYDALKPKKLRLPFFGTFSGIRATVGGGLSQGALFMGTARYGQGADIVLGLEVVLADGTLLTTGQGAFKNGKPFYRTYGPDLTGLFVHDNGAFGVKVRATLKLMQAPAETDYISFVYPDIEKAALGLSEIARSGAAEEAYVFDPHATKRNLKKYGIVQDAKTLAKVVTGQSSLAKGVVEGAKLVAAGRDFIEGDVYSLHVVCAGRNAASVKADMDACRALAERHGGKEIANSIPKAVRANPFQPLNSILGPDGDRWAALNSKVPHTKALKLIRASNELVAGYKDRMDAAGVYMTHLMIAISSNAFSFEPVFHWFDEWLPVHRRTPEPDHLATLTEPPRNPAARALVEEMRDRMTAVFAEHGAASNQIGKTYPYFQSLNPETAKLLKGLKDLVDPQGLMNPGNLGME